MKALAEQISDIDGVSIYGRVVGVRGLMVEIAGPIHAMSVGARIVVETGTNRFIPCEVIGFTGSNAVVMPFAGLEGVRRGCRAVIANAASQVRPSASWLGRVVNAMGEPIDGKGPLAQGPSPMPYRNLPPPAHSRRRVGAPLDLGVRSLNTFLTCCRGQRMGIFAGSGVGKSVLLSMLARNVDADISVIGLVGERAGHAGERERGRRLGGQEGHAGASAFRILRVGALDVIVGVDRRQVDLGVRDVGIDARQRAPRGLGTGLREHAVRRERALGGEEGVDVDGAVAEQVALGHRLDDVARACALDPLVGANDRVGERLGRVRAEKWGPRVIDLDLLVVGSEIRGTDTLTLPHAGIAGRDFVLYPLADVAPDLEVAGLGVVRELRSRVANRGLEKL